jgi:hypothetical protein
MDGSGGLKNGGFIIQKMSVVSMVCSDGTKKLGSGQIDT